MRRRKTAARPALSLVVLISASYGVLLPGVAASEAFAVPLSQIRRLATSPNDLLIASPAPHLHVQVPRGKLPTGALRLSGGEVKAKANKSSFILDEPIIREMLAEFVGTYLLVQIGCGTVCSAIYLGAQAGLWQIAAVWSIAVTLGISTTAAISGAHLNPAISFALALLRPSNAFGWGKFIPYVSAQILGAVTAAGFNFALFRDACSEFEATKGIVRGSPESILSASAFGEYWSVSSWQTAFFAEALGTAILAFVIFALTNPKNGTTSKNSMLVPPLIGATVGSLISVIAPLTQAGFNPARDFGPRIIATFTGWGKAVAMKGWWLYVVGPFLGAPIGAFVADKVLYRSVASASE